MTFGPFPPTPLGLALNLATEQARDREEQERREYEQEHTRRAPERERPQRPARTCASCGGPWPCTASVTECGQW